MLIVLLFLTGPLAYMPTAVLASVVFIIGIRLIDVKGMRRIFHLSRAEFIVAAITAGEHLHRVVVFPGIFVHPSRPPQAAQ